MQTVRKYMAIATACILVAAMPAMASAATPDQRTQNFKSTSAKAIQAGARKDTGQIPTIAPKGHQLIKASVLNDDPASFTIDVKKFANINVNEDAPTFAVYTTGGIPKQCGDFRNLVIRYSKPDKYKRQFNLSKHGDVLKAIDSYGCVVMRNIPSK